MVILAGDEDNGDFGVGLAGGWLWLYPPGGKLVWNAQYLKSGLRRRRVLRAGNVIIRLLCYVGASDKVYLVTDLRN